MYAATSLTNRLSDLAHRFASSSTLAKQISAETKQFFISPESHSVFEYQSETH